MPQEAIIAVAYFDEEGRHAGFVTIHLPHGGDPANAGSELLGMGDREDAASALRRSGFRDQPQQARPGWSYKDVMRHAEQQEVPHIYRLQNGGWEYQRTAAMYRSLTLNDDTLNLYATAHDIRTKATRSPHENLLPPEMREEAPANS